MTMMEDFNQWNPPVARGQQPMQRPMAQPSFAPIGEMIGERMEWDSPWQNTIREDMDRDWRGFYDRYPFEGRTGYEKFVPAELADIGRTTTMGTGYEFPTVSQPLISPPPTYDYTGTGGLGGLSPSIPFANTLMPPAGQEMMGNWGGGAANRQEWTGPLANPFPNIWNPFETYRYPGNTFWGGGLSNDPFIRDRRNSTQNFALNNWSYLTNPMQGINAFSDWLRTKGY